jgi:hypothetical protein
MKKFCIAIIMFVVIPAWVVTLAAVAGANGDLTTGLAMSGALICLTLAIKGA